MVGRQRRVGGIVVAGIAAASLAAASGAATPRAGSECRGQARGLVAYRRVADLRLLDLATCRDRLLAHGTAPPIRFSPSGRWVAYGAGSVVSVSGGPVLHPLPAVGFWRHSWAWSPRNDLLAAVTKRGGVLLGGPGRPVRRVVRDGWGAEEVAFADDGSLTVSRSVFSSGKQRWTHQEIWGFLGPNLTPNQFLGTRAGSRTETPRLATWSPDGHWIFFFLDPYNSASIAADGLPLYVKGPALGALGPRIAGRMLLYDDFLSWCGNRLVAAAGGDRYATHGKHLVVASPPVPAYGQLWRTRELSRAPSGSWVSPACSPDGARVAAAVGRNWIERRFGQERRSIWILTLDGASHRRLTVPPAGATDESPHWSRDGRFILFARSGGTSPNASARGALRVVSVRDGRLSGPLASIGPTGNYYGHYGWSDDFDWYQPPSG